MRQVTTRRRPGGRCLLAALLAHTALVTAVVVVRSWKAGQPGSKVVALDHPAADFNGVGCPVRNASGVGLPSDAEQCQALLHQLQRRQEPDGCLPLPNASSGVGEQPGTLEEEEGVAAALVGAEVPGCCDAAAAFLRSGCHCLRASFSGASLSWIQELAAACHGLEQQQPQHVMAGAQPPPVANELIGGGSRDSSEHRDSSGGATGAAARSRSARLGSTVSKNHSALALVHPHAHRPGAASGGGSGSDSFEEADIRLYVGILSAAAKRAARDAIRDTWATHKQLHSYKFFLARPDNDTLYEEVRLEAAQLQDLVLLPEVREHYSNITHQTLEACRFAAADPLATHLLKLDDDSYVRIGRLVRLLATLPRERLFLGNIEDPGGGPHRNPSSQWYVSVEEWPSERYPPWAHGTGYVLSADLLREIAAGAAYKPLGGRLFKLEDIAVGSWVEWVAQERNWTVRLEKDRRFNFLGCRPSDVVSHYISPEQHRCMWHHRGVCGRRCALSH